MRAGNPVISRRAVLGSFAAAAAVGTLGACSSNNSTGKDNSAAQSSDGSRKGSVTEPMKTPSSFKESPAVTALVDAGTLPALADRIPANPYVVPHRWLVAGTYGGTMKMSINDTANSAMYENFYGYSFVRYLNNGLDIGPGLAESWEVNRDSTQFTFHFRKGLRWSDGKPWTTADVMYWWEDLVENQSYPMSPPDDVRDGRDQIAAVTAVDDTTLRLSFKNPAPAAVERIAAWVNGTGSNGAAWTLPKHYLSQFHPKYNKAIDSKSDWQTAHDRKLKWLSNPDCPTMVGWRCETYREGRSVVLTRNPYYYADRRSAALHRPHPTAVHAGPTGPAAAVHDLEGRLRAWWAHGSHPCRLLLAEEGRGQRSRVEGPHLGLGVGHGVGDLPELRYEGPQVA